MKLILALLSFLIIFFIIFSTTFSQTISSNSGEVSAISIDGKISDPEWSGAKVFNDFFITVPRSDEKYYDSTIVYVKQTKDALNFAFKFWPTGKVISKSFTRDRSTDEENEFFIMLDLENKNQNGYFFAFSFLNNQRDGMVYNQRNISYEWDWVWEAKSTIFREAKDGKPGYIESEIRIPVDKLQNKNQKQIGFDLQLFAYKTDGTLYTYSVIPGSELLTVKSTYKFDLKQPFNEKLNLNFNVAPYAVANKFNGRKLGATFGGDVNISFEKHKLKGTVNTDQSTLEADPFRFTFYNRPVFLTEKRPFFSKDLDIYRTPINLFYTRSIDSIDYGVNYTYRSDKLKAGFVYVNEPKDTTSKTFIAARPNLNFPDFNLGGLFIYTHDKRDGSIDRIMSFDGLLRVPNSRLRFSAQAAGSFNEKSGLAYVLNSFYENSYTGGPYFSLSYGRIDKNFQSSTSFNSQTGAPNDYDEIAFQPGYSFRFDRKYFTDINFNLSYYRGRQLSTNFIFQERYGAELFYKLNDMISVDHYYEINRPNDYDVNGNMIRRSNYDLVNNIKFLIGSSALNIGYEFGKYYDSFIKHPYVNLDLVLFDMISLRLAYDYNRVFNIKQSIFSAKLDWRVIPQLYIRSYYQQDTHNRRALWNSMVQYEFFAGSSIYLVMNLQGEKLQNTGRYFKVGYEFNF
ncbi:MAG: hypothetical protein EHM58_10040 [Ignavibacteriae bacterium]|nr:MAG: hypothetical protein EHM58_10040 [Ignavibacteriota bacterium]